MDRIKVINAIINGIRITAVVKLKFSTKRENKNMPFGWIGLSGSSRLFLFRELYPFANFKDERAAKQGFNSVRVIKEKKLICTTAIISTPTILPDMTPSTKNPKATPAMTVLSAETTDAVL